MTHAVLLGDSILDNGAYVSGGSPVVEQLRSRLPKNWRVTLLARDGAVALGVLDQLQQLPSDASHLVISAGGNDALESTPLLNSPLPDSKAMLAEMVDVQNRFRRDYQEMLLAVNEVQIPIIACTIYDAVPDLRPHERMALSLFNDIIVRELVLKRIPILDLRAICTESCDYAEISPIEPSEIGGSKIARALHSILLKHDFSHVASVVYR